MNGYVRPAIEFETFELNSAIANSCAKPLPFAPTAGEFAQCDEYEEIPMTQSNVLLMSAPASGSFSDNNDCYCTLSSTGDGFAS